MAEPRRRAASTRPSSSSEDLLAFARLLAELSARFINLPSAEVDAAITDALRRIVEILGVDRANLLRFPQDAGDANVTHSWATTGVPAVAPRSLSDSFPWGLRHVRGGHALVLARLDELPPEAAVDKASWERVGVKSNLTMPMIVGGRVEGAIALGCLRRRLDWPEELVAQMRILAEVFANALAHKRAQEALNSAIDFERMASAVLAALLAAGPTEQDSVIVAALRDLALLLGAERVILWERLGDQVAFFRSHRWLVAGAATPADSADRAELPWVSAQLVAGSIVSFARHADLPPDASTDLPALAALDVRAAVIVPLAVSGAVVGALAFGTRHEDREWPEALVPRAKLLGEVFAGVLARREAERRQQEAQAHAAHAARVGTMGVFAASLVHELTQPVSASLANAEIAAELLAAPSPDLRELRATVADILADDRRARELIQQLRRFLRRGEVERIELDLRELVEDVVRLIGNAAAAKRIEIAIDVSDALPKFMGDRVQLQQVLLNLLLNGCDAIADDPPALRRISVVARSSSPSTLSLEITDSGRGLEEPLLARVFQPFFTTKPGGMGLGLSIAQTIVAMHGGTISVRSTLGRGTTFRIELPSKESVEPWPVLTGPAPIDGGHGGTVYVIEDDASMLRALSRHLTGAGHRVEAFATAMAYLDQASSADIGCIVSDVRMPGLSGLDLQASLVRANRNLPMVFISGHGDIATTVHAMRAGAVSFLPKPFTSSELLAAVEEALARSREVDRTRRESAGLRSRYESLTPREREVFALVTKGMLNKVIADRLGAAQTTIKIHRGRVMDKMGARSVADLVKMAGRLALASSASTRH